MHGTHHVAQKFTTTTLPEAQLVSMTPPCRVDAGGSQEGRATIATVAVACGAGAAAVFRKARYSAASPVEPGKVYHLSFARKSQRLTTDQGVFLEVSGYQCEGLKVRSSPVVGTTSWLREELEVAVPGGCEAIQLQVRREESMMFDSKISGNYWLDGVEMIE